jgi:hypothetical protein
MIFVFLLVICDEVKKRQKAEGRRQKGRMKR